MRRSPRPLLRRCRPGLSLTTDRFDAGRPLGAGPADRPGCRHRNGRAAAGSSGAKLTTTGPWPRASPRAGLWGQHASPALGLPASAAAPGARILADRWRWTSDSLRPHSARQGLPPGAEQGRGTVSRHGGMHRQGPAAAARANPIARARPGTVPITNRPMAAAPGGEREAGPAAGQPERPSPQPPSTAPVIVAGRQPPSADDQRRVASAAAQPLPNSPAAAVALP